MARVAEKMLLESEEVSCVDSFLVYNKGLDSEAVMGCHVGGAAGTKGRTVREHCIEC